jgi:hypothetical protein
MELEQLRNFFNAWLRYSFINTCTSLMVYSKLFKLQNSCFIEWRIANQTEKRNLKKTRSIFNCWAQLVTSRSMYLDSIADDLHIHESTNESTAQNIQLSKYYRAWNSLVRKRIAKKVLLFKAIVSAKAALNTKSRCQMQVFYSWKFLYQKLNRIEIDSCKLKIRHEARNSRDCLILWRNYTRKRKHKNVKYKEATTFFIESVMKPELHALLIQKNNRIVKNQEEKRKQIEADELRKKRFLFGFWKMQLVR